MFELKFVARSTDIDRWVAICELMENGDCGINLQEQMEVFGMEVDQKLESILDKRGAEGTFLLEQWFNNNNEFTLLFHLHGLEQREETIELFILCPITILKVNKF